MLRATLKSLFARKRRLVLTVTSIVLGVGFVAGTYVLTDTMNAAFDELFSQAASGSDVIVRAEQAFAPSATGPGGGGRRRTRHRARASAGHGATGAGCRVRDGRRLRVRTDAVDPATGDAIGGVGPPTIGTNWNAEQCQPRLA